MEWNKEEIKILKEKYPYSSNKELGIVLNKTKGVIYYQAEKLGIKKTQKTISKILSKSCKGINRTWTKKEEELLRKNYLNYSNEQLKKFFNKHGIRGVIAKASRLGVSGVIKEKQKEQEKFLIKNYKNLNYEDIAKKLNKTKGYVFKKCSRMGLIKNKRWTDNEIKILKENYELGDKDYLIKSIKKDWKIIKYKAQKLKIKRKNRFSDEDRKNMGNARKKLFKEGKSKSWSKGLTKETNKSLAKISERMINNNPMKNPEIIQKAVKTRIEEGTFKGENNPNFNNWSSFEPYTPDFNKQFKQKIKERDNHCCVVCNKSNEGFEDIPPVRLDIHHCDYNKLNSFPQNCVTLCVNCHMRTNYNRNHWTKFFQSLLVERYNYEYSEDQKIILDFTV